MNTQSLLAGELQNKEYRDAFVGAQIRIGLPMQCRALRESRRWTQPQLAEAAGMSQPRISEIERPGERKLNLDTLLRLASAFDVGLQVRFVPFSKLVDDDDSIDLDSFYVQPFEEDLARLEKIEEKMRSPNVLAFSRLKLLASNELNKALAPGQKYSPFDQVQVGQNGANEWIDGTVIGMTGERNATEISGDRESLRVLSSGRTDPREQRIPPWPSGSIEIEMPVSNQSELARAI